MAGLNTTLEIGRSSLLAYQTAINITGHNISNVNTDGYSRQRVNMVTNEPLSIQPGQIGTGIKIEEVQRIYDQFITNQINNENQELGNWSARDDILGRVEFFLNESEDSGLNNIFNEFWNSWQDLANKPSGSAERQILVARTEQLGSYLKNIYQNLEQIQKDIDTQINGTLTDINNIATKITDLNNSIEQVESNQINANDLRDSRDTLLKELSLLIDFTSTEDTSGKTTVTLGDGNTLVGSNPKGTLNATTNLSGHTGISWSDGTAIDSSSINGGKIEGWLNVRDNDISGYLTRLDTFAQTLKTEMNSQHILGKDLAGNTGIFFFNDSLPADETSWAKNLTVNSEILIDPDKIAASLDGNGAGDNSNAIAIANIQNKLVMGASTETLNQYYKNFISGVGSDAYTASFNNKSHKEIMTQLENYRESVSGVSIDEEMINMVAFQKAYNASAKLITTVDELMDSIINMI